VPAAGANGALTEAAELQATGHYRRHTRDKTQTLYRCASTRQLLALRVRGRARARLLVLDNCKSKGLETVTTPPSAR